MYSSVDLNSENVETKAHKFGFFKKKKDKKNDDTVSAKAKERFKTTTSSSSAPAEDPHVTYLRLLSRQNFSPSDTHSNSSADLKDYLKEDLFKLRISDVQNLMSLRRRDFEQIAGYIHEENPKDPAIAALSIFAATGRLDNALVRLNLLHDLCNATYLENLVARENRGAFKRYLSLLIKNLQIDTHKDWVIGELLDLSLMMEKRLAAAIRPHFTNLFTPKLTCLPPSGLISMRDELYQKEGTMTPVILAIQVMSGSTNLGERSIRENQWKILENNLEELKIFVAEEDFEAFEVKALKIAHWLRGYKNSVQAEQLCGLLGIMLEDKLLKHIITVFLKPT